MFDELASSQTIRPAQILQKLDDLDRDLRRPKQLKPFPEVCPLMAAARVDCSSEGGRSAVRSFASTQPAEELQGVDDLVVTFELMLRSLKSQRVRKSPGRTVKQLSFELIDKSYRYELASAWPQTKAWRHLRGALSARQSQAQAVGEVVESAPETPPKRSRKPSAGR